MAGATPDRDSNKPTPPRKQGEETHEHAQERDHDPDSDPPRTAVPPGRDKPLREDGRQEGC
jgi:hypothetical protein